MNYKVVTLDENGNKTYVVQNAKGHPVSERYLNKTQALKVAADYINEVLQESEEVKALPEVVVEVDVSLTHKSVGMFKASDGCWMVSIIPFDPKTGNVGPIQVERAGLNRREGEEKVRITVANAIFKGND